MACKILIPSLQENKITCLVKVIMVEVLKKVKARNSNADFQGEKVISTWKANAIQSS